MNFSSRGLVKRNFSRMAQTLAFKGFDEHKIGMVINHLNSKEYYTVCWDSFYRVSSIGLNLKLK